MSHWPRFLPIVLTLALLACVVQTDDPTRSPAPASILVPTRPPEVTLANQDVLLQHCIESEMRRGNISHAEASDALGNLAAIRDPGDPYRLGLVVQCSELGYLAEVAKWRSTQASASVSPTSIPTVKATRTPAPTAIVPTSTPTPNPLPAELTSGVNALVHCAGETVEYWLEHGPPTLTADLVGCLNSYLEQVEG